MGQRAGQRSSFPSQGQGPSLRRRPPYPGRLLLRCRGRRAGRVRGRPFSLLPCVPPLPPRRKPRKRSIVRRQGRCRCLFRRGALLGTQPSSTGTRNDCAPRPSGCSICAVGRFSRERCSSAIQPAKPRAVGEPGSDERWSRTWDLFHQALERPLAERDAFLDGACGDDLELRERLRASLRSHERRPGILDRTGPGALADLEDPFVGFRLDPYLPPPRGHASRRSTRPRTLWRGRCSAAACCGCSSMAASSRSTPPRACCIGSPRASPRTIGSGRMPATARVASASPATSYIRRQRLRYPGAGAPCSYRGRRVHPPWTESSWVPWIPWKCSPAVPARPRAPLSHDPALRS